MFLNTLFRKIAGNAVGQQVVKLTGLLAWGS